MADTHSSSVSDHETKSPASVSDGSSHLKEFLSVAVNEGKGPKLKTRQEREAGALGRLPPLVGEEGKMPPTLIITDDVSDEREPSNDKLKYFGFTKRQWKTLIIFGIANVLSTTVISLQAPFYPREAEAKGASASEYGLVFGCFQLTMFVMSPIYGSIVSRVNPRLMFNLGIFTAGACAILFGFLDYIQGRILFIAMSFVVRIVQACGDAAFVTASFTIIAIEFPESIATTFAAMETCSGVGLIIGPTLGGALYEVGGFLLPFLTSGLFLFSVSIATFFFLPGLRNGQRSEHGESAVPSGFGFFKLMRIPPVALSALSIMIASGSIGFLAATLEPHLRAKFQLTPLYTGLVFIIDGGMYAITAPLWGRLCDRSAQPKYITLVGCVLSSIAYLLIGPPPFMPFDTILWVTCVGLVIYGVGVGATLVSAFIQALSDAMDRGFPDGVATYGLVSGMWMSAFALGAFIGPSVGGFLLDNFGFQQASVYILGAQVLMAILVIIFIASSICSRKPVSGEKEPLLIVAPKIDDPYSQPGNSKQKNYSGDKYGSF